MKELRVLIILALIAFLLNAIFSKASFLSNLFESHKIIPKEQWSQTLVGKWEYEYERKNFNEIYFFEGDVEYFADGTFKRHITLSIYQGHLSVKKIKEDLIILGGGTYEGKWAINEDQSWLEETTKCETRTEYVKVNYNDKFDICSFYTDKNSKLTYGSYETYDIRSSIATFTNKKILIKGESIPDKGTRVTKFTRI